MTGYIKRFDKHPHKSHGLTETLWGIGRRFPQAAAEGPPLSCFPSILGKS